MDCFDFVQKLLKNYEYYQVSIFIVLDITINCVRKRLYVHGKKFKRSRKQLMVMTLRKNESLSQTKTYILLINKKI